MKARTSVFVNPTKRKIYSQHVTSKKEMLKRMREIEQALTAQFDDISVNITLEKDQVSDGFGIYNLWLAGIKIQIGQTGIELIRNVDSVCLPTLDYVIQELSDSIYPLLDYGKTIYEEKG